MARPPLPLGTAGKIKTFPIAGGYRSRVRYRDHDGVTRQIEKTAKTRGAAERLIAEAVRDRSRSDSAAEITPDTKMVTVVEAWWTETARRPISPGTLRLYRDRLDRQIIPSLGNLRVRELTVGVCDRHLRAVRDNNGPSTAKATRSVLSGICGFAARHDALERNPVRDTGKISAKPKKVPTALTIAAVKNLRAALLGTQRTVDRDLPDFVDMMLATGLRIGECSAVTWACVDLDAGTVDVRGIVIRVRGQGLIIRRDESSKLTERTLDLPSWAVEMLRKRKSRLTPKQLREVDAPVFPAPFGGLRDPSNTQADLREAFADAGMPGLTSHVFRRTVATLMDDEGLTVRAAADQLGHSKPAMTLNNYMARKKGATGAAAVLEALR